MAKTIVKFKTEIKHDTGIYLPCYKVTISERVLGHYVSKEFVVAKLSSKNWILCTNRDGNLEHDRIVKTFGVSPTLKTAISAGERVFEYQ